MALWTVSSIPAAVVNPAWTAVVAAVIPPRRRPSVNGTRWALLSVVTAISGVAFGRTLDVIASPLNFQVVFFVSFLAGMVTLFTFDLIRMPDPRKNQTSGTLPTRPPVLSLRQMLRISQDYPPFARFVLTSFVYRIGLNLPTALFSIYWVHEANASNTVIGIQSTAANLALVGSYLLWGRLATRRGHRIVLLLSSADAALYPLATAFVRDALWLIPVALIWGIFASGIDVSFFQALLRTCPSDRLQTFIGINRALANLVVFVAPLAAAISLIGTALFYSLSIAKDEPAVRVPAGEPAT